MRHFLALVIIMTCTVAGVSHAGEQKASPCISDFELRVAVAPVEPTEDSEIGVSLKLGRGAKRGIASRIHTDQNSEFNRSKCSLWQKQYWPLVGRILLENKRPERQKLICRSIASIDYRVGSKHEAAKVCLGSAEDDGLTYGFHKLYEGTDQLVAR